MWYVNGAPTGVTTQAYAPGNLTATTSFYCAITSGTCGTANTATTTITVNASLAAAISGGSSLVCYNSAPGTLTVTATGGGGAGSYTYMWYKNGVSTGRAMETYDPGNLTATSSFYCVVTSGTCGTANTPLQTVTVNPLPGAAGPITGSLSVTQGNTSVAYSIPIITDATNYDWTPSSGASIFTGNNTRSITLNFSASATSGNIVVSGRNACGSGSSSSLSVTVIPAISLSTNLNGLQFGSLSDIQDIAVYSNTTWTATKSLSWITVTPASGSGNGSIGIRVTKLLSGTRTGYVTLKTTDGSVTVQIQVSQNSAM